MESQCDLTSLDTVSASSKAVSELRIATSRVDLPTICRTYCRENSGPSPRLAPVIKVLGMRSSKHSYCSYVANSSSRRASCFNSHFRANSAAVSQVGF